MASIFDSASELLGKGAQAAADALEKGKDVAGDLASKGKEVADGFPGNVSGLVDKTKLKAKLYDNGLEVDRLMRELGHAVYEQLKDDPAHTEPNQELFEKISAALERKQELEDQIAEAEAAAAAGKPIDVEPVPPEELADASDDADDDDDDDEDEK